MFHIVSNIYVNIRKYLLFCIVIFINFPPLRPPSFVDIVHTHNIARLFVIILLVDGTIKLFKNKLRIQRNLEYNLILIYLSNVSISILNSENIPAYLISYKNILFGLLIYFVIQFENRLIVKAVIKLLVFISFVQLIYEILIYIFPIQSFAVLQLLLYSVSWEDFRYQFTRGRYYIEIFSEYLIPLIVYKCSSIRIKLKNKIIYNAGCYLFIGIIAIFVLLSNWRSKLISCFIGLLFSAKLIGKSVFAFFFLIVIFMYALYSVSLFFGINTAVQRIVAMRQNDVQSTIGRLGYWKSAVEMGFASPLLGYGVGSFQDYTQIPSDQLGKKMPSAHNSFVMVFAETGLLGILSYSLMIFYFLYIDIAFWVNHNSYRLLDKGLIAAFWTLFSYSLFNPTEYFGYMSIFWVLRGLIKKCKYEQK